MRRRYEPEEHKNYNLELNQERAFWENQLNQKINFFLLFFALIVAGVAFSKSKEFTLTVLLVGAVILWFLSLMIMNATRKINIVQKELMKDASYPVSVVDLRSKGRLFRIIVGYGLPIFCAVVVTLAFVSGISGLYSFGFPTKTEVVRTVDKAVQTVKEKFVGKPKADSSAKYFESVDKAIADGNSQVVISDSLPKVPKVVASTKTSIEKKAVMPSKQFQTVDNVIAEENAKRYDVPPVPVSQAVQKQAEKTVAKKMTNDSQYFKSIDEIIPSQKDAKKRIDTVSKSKEVAKPAKTIPIKK